MTCKIFSKSLMTISLLFSMQFTPGVPFNCECIYQIKIISGLVVCYDKGLICSNFTYIFTQFKYKPLIPWVQRAEGLGLGFNYFYLYPFLYHSKHHLLS